MCRLRMGNSRMLRPSLSVFYYKISSYLKGLLSNRSLEVCLFLLVPIVLKDNTNNVEYFIHLVFRLPVRRGTLKRGCLNITTLELDVQETIILMPSSRFQLIE